MRAVWLILREVDSTPLVLFRELLTRENIFADALSSCFLGFVH